MKIGIDLDSTICTDRYDSGGVSKCKLLPGAKEKIDKMKKAGHEVIIFTHRGYDLKDETIKWLKKHNIQADEVIFEKPHFDFYLGDEAVRFYQWDLIDISSEGELIARPF